MRSIVLLSLNYLREQRVFLLVMSGYLLLGGGLILFTPGGPDMEDLAFLVKQQAGYAGFIGIFMTALVLFGERRSRRILAVLSKGVERWQYLCSILLGSCLALAVYLALLWISAYLVFSRHAIPTESLTTSLVLVGLAAVLGAAIALFYSTFLHPLMVFIATAITVAVPHALSVVVGGPWEQVMPAYHLSAIVAEWEPGSPLGWPASLVFFALIDTALFVIAAIQIFRYRDIAAAVE